MSKASTTQYHAWHSRGKYPWDCFACCKEALRDAIALRSEAQGELDQLRELICDVAASGVVFEDERLDYLEIQVDRQTWDEVCALAARQQGGSDG